MNDDALRTAQLKILHRRIECDLCKSMASISIDDDGNVFHIIGGDPNDTDSILTCECEDPETARLILEVQNNGPRDVR